MVKFFSHDRFKVEMAQVVIKKTADNVILLDEKTKFYAKCLPPYADF